MSDSKEAKHYWRLFWLAGLTYAITLFSVQYTGEEAVYTLQSYEMWYRGEYLVPTQLGEPYQRPALYNWLIMAFSWLLGWDKVLMAARLVSALSSLASGLLLAWFVRRVWNDRLRAAFSAMVFISLWDVLGYYGWLAYSDAPFGFFCLTGMLFAWLAVRERSLVWLTVALLGACCGFMTKALTAYIFYGVAMLISLWRMKAWRFTLSPVGWLLHLAALTPPLWWRLRTPSGAGMVHDISDKLGGLGLLPYLKQITSFPLMTLGNLLPLGALALWVMWRQRKDQAPATDENMRLAAWIALVNFLPYWLAPQSGGRYLLPLYGLLALLVSAPLYATPELRRLATRWVMAAIAFKVVIAAWAFPAYTHKIRPDIAAIAADVERITADQPLYSNDVAWVGLSVAATLDVARAPRPPLEMAGKDMLDGFILVEAPDPAQGQVVKAYKGTYLLCRGSACSKIPRN